MEKVVEYTLFTAIIIAVISWILGFDEIYLVSAVVMVISGGIYWFKYIVPELYGKKNKKDDNLEG